MDDIILTRFTATMATPGAAPTAEDVSYLEAAYPYFVLPAAVRLARATDISDRERAHLEQRMALTASNPGALFRLIDPEGRIFADFYPAAEEKQAPTTDSAITTFLETYGKSDPHEDEILTKLIFNPVAEYAASLAAESAPQPAAEKNEQDTLLDAFLERFDSGAPHPAAPRAEKPQPAAPAPRKQPASKADEDSLLSESLAKVYISRGRYDKAYEIIHNLSLNFPKKSIYFADQLRFLQKLIANSKFKDK